MAYFVRVIKASIINRRLNKYEEIKRRALAQSELVEKQGFIHEWKRDGSVRKWRGFLKKNYFSNFYSVSFCGYLGGATLTLIFFFFALVGFRSPLGSTTAFASILAVFLCLGLAFSSQIRCYVLLTLPQLFSKRGRQALTAYVFVLALTGPLRNTIHNLGILSDSISCGQEQLKRTMKHLVDMVRQPFIALKETLKQLTEDIKYIVKPIKDLLDKFEALLSSVLAVIKAVTSWLGSIAAICNREMGSPYERCIRKFVDAELDCQVKLGVMKFLCAVVKGVKQFCHTLKVVDMICIISTVVSDFVVAPVKRKMVALRTHIRQMFEVSIEVKHSFHFDTNSSKSTKSIVNEIATEYEARAEFVKKIFNFFGLLFGFVFLFLFIKMLHYRHKFLTSDKFDNKYITNDLVEIDLRRLRLDKETVLPLELHERPKYITASSIRLLKSEKRKLVQSLTFLVVTTVQAVMYPLCDQGLYWMLTLIKKETPANVFSGEIPMVGINVEGSGVMADLYSRIGGAVHPPAPGILHDPTECLPHASRPDYDKYAQMGLLLLLCWLLALTEPYGLRLRSRVMSYYYPERAKERALWLYNHILQSRGSIFRFARRQLRRKLKSQDTENISLWQRLVHRNPLMLTLFGGGKGEFCSLCAAPETQDSPLIHCPNPQCNGMFCPACLIKLQKVCSLCRHPLDYGDLTDVSEEIDSSEEEKSQRNIKKRGYSEEDEKWVDSEEDTTPHLTFRETEIRPAFEDIENMRHYDYVTEEDLYDTVADDDESTISEYRNSKKAQRKKFNSGYWNFEKISKPHKR